MNYKDNYYEFDNLDLKHGFFIKPFNFNPSTLEDTELKENYDKVKEILSLENISIVKQEHTNIIRVVDESNMNDYEVADGMITNVKGIGLATRVADCQAILLYDPVTNTIGNVHSGWKGTVIKIVKEAVLKMQEIYNVNPSNLKVYICPSIGRCHFEVDEDVYLKFKESFNEVDIDKYTEIKKDINKYYLDTEKINRDLLISLGVKENNITLSNMCTVCSGETIHSYRYDKDKSGRNLAIISL